MSFPYLGFGVGLRPKHYPYILSKNPSIDWFEIISENYMGVGGQPLFFLDQIRERYPVVMHGVSLSIGSTDPLNLNYLRDLKALADRIHPRWISDHLCWTGVHGKNLHDLVPLPFTEETLQHLASRIRQVQDFLERPLVIENVSSYMEFSHSKSTEWDFLAALTQESGCKLLLDINNIYVSSFNHHFNPINFIEAIPSNAVVQFHLAGHSTFKTHLLDTHDHPIKKEVLDLYRVALERFGPVSTLVEWDDKIPSFPRLLKEVAKAQKVFADYERNQRNTA